MLKKIGEHLKSKNEGSGSIVGAMVLFILIMMLALCYYFTTKYQVRCVKVYVEDNIVSSNLASLIFDKPLYYDSIMDLQRNGVDEERSYQLATLHIDADDAYDTFVRTLKHNLQLDDEYNFTNYSCLDNATINQFIVYDVAATAVDGVVTKSITVTTYNTAGKVSEQTYTGVNALNTQAPNGKIITESCTYADIGYDITLMIGGTYTRSSKNMVELSRQDSLKIINR